MNAPTKDAAPIGNVPASSLEHFPVGLFAVGMGVTGLGLAWRKAAHVLHWEGLMANIGEGVLILSLIGFTLVVLAFAAKWKRFPGTVAKEFDHPVMSNFFAAVTISVILFASAAFPYSKAFAEALWLAGSLGHFALTLRLMGRWITVGHEIPHLSPAWFIPVVGNIVTPILGLKLGYVELSWFLFSVGFTMWIVFFTIVIYRIVFHPPMPARLTPTLFIMIAPPTIGFVSYSGFVGGVDVLGRILFHLGVFLALLLVSRPRLFTVVPFAPSWWAYTFPLDALALSAFTYGEMGGFVPSAVSLILLGIATVVVGYVSIRTAMAALDRSLLIGHG